jgi:hypothetical protein
VTLMPGEKMKIISVKNHGYLDYVTVLAFALIPTLFGFEGIPAYLSYALAAIHLLMTLLTAFPLGVAKVIPVKLHKLVETLVGPFLILSPWLIGFSENLTARYVYVAMGLIVIAVGFLTDY